MNTELHGNEEKQKKHLPRTNTELHGKSEPEALATVGNKQKGIFTDEGFCITVAYASGSDSYFRSK